MKFKIDENLPVEVAAEIRNAGHEADTVYDQQLGGASDDVIMARMQVEYRAILTLDKGIADMRKYLPSAYSGIVLFRPQSTGRDEVLAFVRQRLPAVLQIDLNGRLLVVSDNGIRVR